MRDFATAGKFTTVLLVSIEVRAFATAGKFTTAIACSERSACLRHGW